MADHQRYLQYRLFRLRRSAEGASTFDLSSRLAINPAVLGVCPVNDGFLHTMSPQMQ